MNIWNITGFFLLVAIMNVLLELLTDLWNYYDIIPTDLMVSNLWAVLWLTAPCFVLEKVWELKKWAVN